MRIDVQHYLIDLSFRRNAMKKLLFVLIGFFLVGFGGPALADGHNMKDPKTIRHCGCYYDSIGGAAMIFHDINVAGKSKGHKKHVVTDDDYDDMCFAGLVEEEPTYLPFERTMADCEVSNKDSDIAQCTGGGDDDEFDVCGEEVIED